MKTKRIKGSWEAQKANRNSNKINLSEKDLDFYEKKKEKMIKKNSLYDISEGHC